MAAMDDGGDEPQLPLIIGVKFDPSPEHLPPGMVDVTDFGDYLDGLQSALNGHLDYDLQTEYLTEDERTRYRLVLAVTRQGSVEAYLVASIVNNLTPQSMQMLLKDIAVLTAGVTVVGGATKLVVDVLRQYLLTVTQKVAERHGDYLADELDLRRMGSYLKRFMGHVRGFAAGNKSDDTSLPPPLVMSMAPGMKKMGDVGAQPYYQDAGGVLLFDDTMPEDVIPFNAGTRHNIDSAIKRAKKRGEPFGREGLVDEPSDRRGTFVLALPNEPASSRYVRCELPNDRDRAVIRDAYAAGSLLRVEGTRLYSSNPGGGKPRSRVIVTRVSPVEQTTLWQEA